MHKQLRGQWGESGDSPSLLAKVEFPIFPNLHAGQMLREKERYGEVFNWMHCLSHNGNHHQIMRCI